MVIAVYNVFDGLELLPYSVKNIEPLVEGIVFVYQDISNYGEFQDTGEDIYDLVSTLKVETGIVHYTPDLRVSAAENERRKREAGLSVAGRMGGTHFLDIDCDEFYVAEEFLKEKARVLNSDLNGLVCKSVVYFSSPTLTIGEDITLVPFLCRIRFAQHGLNKKFPFAFDKTIRIDPTRQLSFTDGIEWSEITMHHYSWVRKDYQKKIRNSSARSNIERSNIFNDLVNAKDKYFCEFYRKPLYKCPNVFGLPEWQKEI